MLVLGVAERFHQVADDFLFCKVFLDVLLLKDGFEEERGDHDMSTMEGIRFSWDLGVEQIFQDAFFIEQGEISVVKQKVSYVPFVHIHTLIWKDVFGDLVELVIGQGFIP